MTRLSLFCFLLFFALTSYAQSLEDDIYHALDKFADNPAVSSWNTLVEQERVFARMAEQDEEHLALVILQCNLAYYAKSFGKHQEAIDYYQKANKAYAGRKLQAYDIIAYCLIPLGNLYTIMGDFINAENTIKSYIFLAEKLGHQTHWTAGIINLSVVYHNTGKHVTAVSILKQALNRPMVPAEKKILLVNNLASNLLAMGKTDEAQQYLKENTTPTEYNTETYCIAAEISLIKNDFESAESYMKKAEEQMLAGKEVTARELARFYVRKSKFFAANGDTDITQKCLFNALRFLLPTLAKDSLPDYEDLYPENTFVDIFDRMAALQQSWSKALGFYDLSFHVSALLKAEITDQEAKILNELSNRKRSEKCIQLLYNQYKTTNDSTLIVRAFEYAESGKASILKEMGDKRSLLEKFPDDSVLQKDLILHRQYEQAVNQLVVQQLNNAPREEVEKSMHTLDRKQHAIRANRKQLKKKYNGTGKRISSLADVNARLKQDKSSMLLFFYGTNHIYLIASDGLALRFEQIPLDAKLKEVIASFIAYFDSPSAINADIDGYKTTAFELYKVLKLSLVQDVENMLIVPDGLLSFVPFEALLTKESPSLLYREMPFLIRRHRVFYNVSANYYSYTLSGKKPTRVLGVFPVFEDSDIPLRYSLNEMDALRNELSGKFLVRKEATKDNFLKYVQEYDIIHLSTHASGGSFSVPAHLVFDDDSMLIYELYSLDIRPLLVVLSACETGVGKLQKGEGAMSVARAFQYAGAQNLLFSLWQVNDLSTSQLMRLFYRSFGMGYGAFSANHKSKLDYLEEEGVSNARKSPYYWAAFVYYGMPEADALLSWRHCWYIGLGLLLFIVCIIYWQRQRTAKAVKKS